MLVNPRAMTAMHSAALALNAIYDGKTKRETTDFVNRLDALAARVL